MAAQQNQQVNNRGWLDTRERVQEALKADSFITELFSRNADLGRLGEGETSTISAAMMICCGIRYMVNQRVQPSSDYIRALAIGELMSPVLPVDHCLQEDDANTVFEEILEGLVSLNSIYTRQNTLVVWIGQVIASFPEVQQEDEAEMGHGITRARARELQTALTQDQHDGITRAERVEFLIWLAFKMPSSQYLEAIPLIVTSYIGIAKRGTVSNRFIEKVRNGMETDLGISVELSEEVIKSAYTMFGRHVHSGNAHGVFERWLADIPEHAMRLRLSLGQVTGSGLTSFVIIGRAMIKYPSFNWAKLNVLTGGEIANYQQAIQAVNRNPYYGFNRDLGAARSTMFSSTAYTAKELLIRLNGEVSLRNYGGWVRQPKSASVVGRMIDQYVIDQTTAIEGAEALEVDVALVGNVARILGAQINANLFA